MTYSPAGGGNYSGSIGPGGYLPTFTNLRNFNVNLNQFEALRQSLYDEATYPAAGTLLLNFFTTPQGQGVAALGGGVKTASDTNMTLAGQIPTNQYFLIQEIEVLFSPIQDATAADLPSGTAATALGVNDAYIFYRSGNLNLNIGSKSYLLEAPLVKFPPRSNFYVTALAQAAGSGGYGVPWGNPYIIKPANLLLISNQNFSLQLAWPEGLQALPSTKAAIVRVTLNGFMYRAAQ